MSFANHNILDIALSLIPPTVVQIRKNQGTVVNKYGQTEASYSEWIDVYGIVQPGGEQNEHTNGVDFSKKHVTIWLRGIALDGTHIQWAPDQIRYVGAIYNVVGVKDWFPYDNYKECDCVEAMNLADSQRGAAIQISSTKKTGTRRRPRADKQESPMQQMLVLESKEIVPTTTPAPPEKPSIFTTETNTDELKKENSLVGKARIKF
jgi:hypothetical protein